MLVYGPSGFKNMAKTHHAKPAMANPNTLEGHIFEKPPYRGPKPRIFPMI
jgi:hypothetical protein